MRSLPGAFLHQQGLDTHTPAGTAMFQMLGVFAQFERAMIQERVRAGLARARGEGKRLGRPPLPEAKEAAIRAALAAPGRPWPPWRACARRAVQGQPVDRPALFSGNELMGATVRSQDVPRRHGPLPACFAKVSS